MKLVRIRMRNFRCYKDEISINLGDLIMFVGRNDVGKSTVFEAMNAFFGEAKLDQDDASKSGDSSDVRIICEFVDFPESIIIDKESPTRLSAEYLLNGEGRLELHQVWDCSKKTPSSAMYAMARHPSASNYSDLLSLKITELKQRAKDLGVDTSQVDTKVSAALRAVIRASAPDLALKDTLIQLDKDSGKKIWEQLKSALPTFALFKADRQSMDTDQEAQDPMKAAMKEAFKALEGTLAGLVDEVKKEVQETANRTVEKLREMSPELASQLHARFTEPNWNTVLKVSLTGDDEIPLNKRGSGVRRLVLLNFFRAKAEVAATERGEAVPVIYAIEEPETSQHPAHQKMLLKALMELAESPGRQVFLTSHNPALARRIPSSSIRYVCDKAGCRAVQDVSGEVMQTSLARDLGVLPDHDVRLFIGVEGINDINFLQHLSKALLDHDVAVPDLFKLEEEGKIVFIPCGGTNLALWADRLAHLNRPEFHVFDGDKPQNEITAQNISVRKNCVGICTTKFEMENYLHPAAIVSARSVAAGISFEDRDDVPLIVAQAVHAASDSGKPWDELEDKKKKEKMSHAKKWLNIEAVQLMTPALLNERDPAGEVLGWFEIIREKLAM